MHEILNKGLFLVKEHLGLFKVANNYDIYDPATGEIVMECREDHLGPITTLLRATRYKRMTPFDIEIRTRSGAQIVRVTRGISMVLSKVSVFDENDQLIGGFQQKLRVIGSAFDVLDVNDTPVCTLKGKWTGWKFKFMAGETQLAHVSKKWPGISREMFTSADNYVLEISDHVPEDSEVRMLILAAVMCIDMVLKE
jgi:uncharacterized protein YxjI